MPDYNYDILSGVDYDIDVAKPVGSRITRLERDGAAVADTDRFVVAVNNYRRSGGGNFPGIVRTQVYNEQKEIRQLLIDWAQAKARSTRPTSPCRTGGWCARARQSSEWTSRKGARTGRPFAYTGDIRRPGRITHLS